jgi:uncharacterized protein YydD (DUF2326 family)
MKLSRLYSNRSSEFGPIDFSAGLNVVLAEIRLPENRAKDTHNLGKSTLGRMIDFCMLAGRDPKFFLFKHQDRFDDFVFFLEVSLLDGGYVTVRRSVSQATKISFLKHEDPGQDFSNLDDEAWDHADVPFKKAKSLLDSFLNLEGMSPWHFRKGLGYFLRSQADYLDVFQLRRFANRHADWKPYLAHMLGFDAELISKHYQFEDELKISEERLRTIRQEIGGEAGDESKLEGILLLKESELAEKQAYLDEFNFVAEDRSVTDDLVDRIDERTAGLNQRRYSLQKNRKRIQISLEKDKVLFSPEEASELFEQVGVVFPSQLKKDFEQLIQFNKAITEERSGYLKEELEEIETEISSIDDELNALGQQRSKALKYLSSRDSIKKYKRTSDELVELRADIVSLERRRQHAKQLEELKLKIRNLRGEIVEIQTRIEGNVKTCSADKASLFSTVRLYFNEIVEQVIDQKALLNVRVNQVGHLDFSAELLDGTGNTTSADRGFSYKKLLCVAFDLALLRAHLQIGFPRFAFHDGILESLDDRKKENLLRVIKEYTQLGIQSVITLIDSDLPYSEKAGAVFAQSEIVLTLHDEGQNGRLFRMEGW